MLLTIIILSSLVALNFLLLFFSCNKTTSCTDTVQNPTTIIIKPEITKQQVSVQLAPTGS